MTCHFHVVRYDLTCSLQLHILSVMNETNTAAATTTSSLSNYHIFVQTLQRSRNLCCHRCIWGAVCIGFSAYRSTLATTFTCTGWLRGFSLWLFATWIPHARAISSACRPGISYFWKCLPWIFFVALGLCSCWIHVAFKSICLTWSLAACLRPFVIGLHAVNPVARAPGSFTVNFQHGTNWAKSLNTWPRKRRLVLFATKLKSFGFFHVGFLNIEVRLQYAVAWCCSHWLLSIDSTHGLPWLLGVDFGSTALGSHAVCEKFCLLWFHPASV